MTSEEILLEKYKILPKNRHQELIECLEFLERKEVKPKPRRSV